MTISGNSDEHTSSFLILVLTQHIYYDDANAPDLLQEHSAATLNCHLLLI